MIEEVFYPRDLRRLVSRLRKEDNLNKNALKILNNQVRILLFGCFFVSAITILELEWDGLVISLALFSALLLIQRPLLQRTFCNSMASYLFGQKKTGIVMRAYFVYPTLPMKILKVKNIEDNSIVKMGPYPQWNNRVYGLGQGPLKGDKVIFFQADDPRYKPVPDNKEIRSLYCLSKSLAEGEDQ